MVWYTYRMEGLLTNIISKNMATFYAAEGLEIALVNQKGFVSYYFLDGDPDWLRRLGEYRQIFKERLKEAKALVQNERQKEAIAQIEAEYGRYVLFKDQVILDYKEGDREIGARLHKEVRNRFFRILDLCEEYKGLHREAIEQVRDKSLLQTRNLRLVAGTAILAVLILGVLLAFVLTKQILIPIRRLALEADRHVQPTGAGDEVNILSQSVRGLIKNADHTQAALEKSRETLLQAEKMASVGKLAAGMAHSVRNPLTSVKMRLFSLHRALELSPTQRDDFEVISEEKNIERLGGRDTIPVDVRIIAATNRNLERALSEGRFREDLYYRLKVVTISLPPLRERSGDIPLLTKYFLVRSAADFGMDNPGITRSEEHTSELQSH